MKLKVVLAVVAAVQVECAPNQLWSGSRGFHGFQSPPQVFGKKPIYTSVIHKGAPSKQVDPAETAHAYEQFINTWLRQASLTLNRPELYEFGARETQTPSEPIRDSVTVGKSVVAPVEEVVVADVPEAVLAPAAEEVSIVETSPVFEEIIPVEVEVVPEVVPEVVEVVPELVEQIAEPAAVTPAVEVVEVIPEAAEVLVEELVEQIPEAVNVSPVAEAVVELTPDVNAAAEVTVVEPEVIAEAVPSLAALDSSHVLTLEAETPAPEVEVIPEAAIEVTPEPVAEAQPMPVLEPIAEPVVVVEPEPVAVEEVVPENPIFQDSLSSASEGKSFSVVRQGATITHPKFPGASFVPSVLVPETALPAAAPSPAPSLPTSAVNTEGLAYTLQFFPTRGRSHYFVSTPIGG